MATFRIPRTRSFHKVLGLIMLLPFIAWSASAVFFLVRPGYDEAYERPTVQQYPAQRAYTIPVNENWLETRYFNTVLGEHLIVRQLDGWRHLHADSLQEWVLPSPAQVSLLLEEAIAANSRRYGELISVEGNQATTDTGVELSLDWTTLSISQSGRDSRWIDRIYSIHYLQWTGIELIDNFLGLAGLFLLMTITYTGTRLAIGLDAKRQPENGAMVTQSEPLQSRSETN